jgi:hypothetical protein
MNDSRTARQGEARSTTKPIDLNTAAVDHAVRLIHQVCCFAGSFDLLDEFRDRALCAAVDRRDSAALFDRLMHDFSFQGISDEIAETYMRRHGQATWRSVRVSASENPEASAGKRTESNHAAPSGNRRAEPAGESLPACYHPPSGHVPGLTLSPL